MDLRLPQLLLLLLSAQLVPYSGVFIRQEVLRLCDQLAEGRQKPLLWCVATQTSFLGLEAAGSTKVVHFRALWILKELSRTSGAGVEPVQPLFTGNLCRAMSVTIKWLADCKETQRSEFCGVLDSGELHCAAIPLVRSASLTCGLLAFPSGSADVLTSPSPVFQVQVMSWQTRKPTTRTCDIILVEIGLDSLTETLTLLPPSKKLAAEALAFDSRGGWPVVMDLLTCLNSPELREWITGLDMDKDNPEYPPLDSEAHAVVVATAQDGRQFASAQEESQASPIASSRLAAAKPAPLHYEAVDQSQPSLLSQQVRTNARSVLGSQHVSKVAPPASSQDKMVMEMQRRTQLLIQPAQRVTKLEQGPSSSVPTTRYAPYPHLSAAGPPPGLWHTMQPGPLTAEHLESSTSSMARGSAAVQEVVNTLALQPHAIIGNFEKQIARELGMLHAGYELMRRHPTDPFFARAFLAQSFKVSLEVSRAGGSMELAWPLLGLPDPREGESQALGPGERVAMAALAKAQTVLSETPQAAENQRGKLKDDA